MEAAVFFVKKTCNSTNGLFKIDMFSGYVRSIKRAGKYRNPWLAANTEYSKELEMDQIKIGKFIGEQRKIHNLTQSELSKKLGITDRAISKWERGICLPDAGLMLDLCKILEISVNELLSGEKIPMENNTEIMEKNLIEMAALNERTNKMLIHTEYVLIALMVFTVVAGCLISSYLVTENWIRVIILGISFLIVLLVAPFCWRIETKTGYYQCSKCGHKYVPGYKASVWAPHIGLTKYMKCPECGKKSWQKKVVK